MDNEQQRQAAYVMDALQNHRWILQLDNAEAVASKPPLFTWLAAGATLIFGRPEPWGMRSISILATGASAYLIFYLARKTWSDRSALFAMAAYLLSATVEKQMGLARMDALLPLTIALGALAALRAWETGRGWKWMWLAAAASTLTKTPLGLLLSAAGLTAIWWERRSEGKVPVRGNHLPGIVLFLTITLGWYFAAAASLGREAVYHKLIVEELLSQSVEKRQGLFPGETFYVSPGLFLFQFLPWSVPMGFALLRIWQKPDADPHRRRVERFVFCWLVVGMAMFSLSPHQRGDLLMPLYVPAAILAGNELDRWTKDFRRGQMLKLGTAIIVIGIGGLGLKRYLLQDKHAYVTDTVAIEHLANEVRSTVGADFPLTHVNDPYALCVELNTMRPMYYSADRERTGYYDAPLQEYYDYDAAAKLLAGDAAVFLCVNRADEFRQHVPAEVKMYELAVTSNGKTHIFSNRATLTPADPIAFGVGTLTIEMHGLKLKHASATDFAFSGSGSVRFTNIGALPGPVHAVIESPRGRQEQSPILWPGVNWDWTVP
jgi:hypothetical protein